MLVWTVSDSNISMISFTTTTTSSSSSSNGSILLHYNTIQISKDDRTVPVGMTKWSPQFTSSLVALAEIDKI